MKTLRFSIFKLQFSILMLVLAGMGLASVYEIPPQAYEWTDLLPRDGTEQLTPGGAGVGLDFDTTVKSPRGGNTIKFTAKDGVASNATITLAAPVDMGTHVGFILNYDSGNFTGDFLRGYEDATKYYQFRPWYPAANYGAEVGKWKVWWVRRDAFTPGGTPAAWATTTSNSTYPVTKFYLAVAPSGSDVNIWFGGILTYTPAKGKIVLRFDDAKKSIHDLIFPLMQAHGWRGVVGVISENIGDEGYMTAADLQELQAAGWDIINHTSVHTQGTGAVTLSAYIDQIGACQTWLAANGLTRGCKFFIAPGNLIQLATGTGCDDIDYLFAWGFGYGHRSIYGGSINGANMVLDETCSYIPNDPMNLPFYTVHSPSQTSYDFFGGVISGIGDQTGCTISEGADSKVLITKAGQFGGVTDGWTPWMDFSATYTDGSYAVLAHTADTITIDLAYSTAVPTCTVYMRDTKSFINKVNIQKAVGIPYTHSVTESPTASDITPAFWDALEADLVSKSATLEVITLSDWYNDLYQIELQSTAPTRGFNRF